MLSIRLAGRVWFSVLDDEMWRRELLNLGKLAGG
jgi:hypothetical protein